MCLFICVLIFICRCVFAMNSKVLNSEGGLRVTHTEKAIKEKITPLLLALLSPLGVVYLLLLLKQKKFPFVLWLNSQVFAVFAKAFNFWFAKQKTVMFAGFKLEFTTQYSIYYSVGYNKYSIQLNRSHWANSDYEIMKHVKANLWFNSTMQLYALLHFCYKSMNDIKKYAS